jgi:hypothetical protein
VIAYSIGVPHLDDGTTYSYLPTAERFYRNELVSQFYEKNDSGEFADLLNEGNIDCIILRLDIESKYNEASNLWKETDPKIIKKWNNTGLKGLIESKKGMKLEKQFGENILIYRIDSEYQVSSSKYQAEKKHKVEQLPAEYLILNTKYLPVTDWANNFAYYKDGWSRGRYDFWRKHLFTQLRQDFIYTNKSDSTLIGKIDEVGDYEVWMRYLTGGRPGNFQFSIFNFQFNVQKDIGEERFIWKKTGDVKLNGETSIEIKNVSGENAIADIVLIERN